MHDPSLILQSLVLAAMLAPPPVSLRDADRFPPPASIRAAVTTNRQYQQYIEQLIVWREASGRDCTDLHDALTQARWLFHVWDAAGGGCGYDGPTWSDDNPLPATEYRLRWLLALRELIGEDAYWRGQLPPNVPFYFVDGGGR